MIIVKIKGGLGNQMFQYACGRFVAQQVNTELKLDISSYLSKNIPSIDTPRNYKLNRFNILEDFIKVFLASLVMAVVIFILSARFHLFIVLPIALIVYFIAAFLFRASQMDLIIKWISGKVKS